MVAIIRTLNVDITQNLIPAQVELIKATCVEYGKAFDISSEIICRLNTTNANILHKECYNRIKELCPLLPTAMIPVAERNACACVKSYNSNIVHYNKNIVSKNIRRAKYAESHGLEESNQLPLLKEWEYHGHHQGKSYKMNMCSITRIDRMNTTTIGTITGRIRITHTIPQWFDEKYPNKRLYSGAVTCQDDGSIILHLSYALTDKDGNDLKTTSVPKHDYENYNIDTVVGIDRGIYHPVATSNGLLISSKPYYAPSRRYAYDVTTLKQKSTPSSRKRLRSLGKRENRYNRDVNHRLSKLISNIPAKCIVLEDLTGVSQQRHKSKKFNRWLHQWSFNDLEEKIVYKCELKGIHVKYVNPKNTSRTCSECHEIVPNARKGNRFKCPICGHEEHADLNAAKNIRDRYLENLRNSLRAHSTVHDVPVID